MIAMAKKSKSKQDRYRGVIHMPDLGNFGQYGRLTRKAPYGTHITLHCKNHPEHKYFTKNIAPIGARTIFNHFDGADCSCTWQALVVDDIDGPETPDV